MTLGAKQSNIFTGNGVVSFLIDTVFSGRKKPDKQTKIQLSP